MERKEAVEVIKKNWPDSSFTMLREALETLIPELAESEDEKIRKRIIHALHGDVLEMSEIKEAVAWLEKQGNNMGISEATKQKLEDNLNKALEKETPESWNKFLDEQKPEDKIEPGQEELTEFEKAVKQVMEEAIECGDTHNLKADADMLLRLVQKPAWCEEDIELLDNTIKFIEDSVAATPPSLRTYSPTLTGKEIPFLKSLKDRVQPKQEWSEEEEKMIQDIINDIAIAQEQVYCKSRCEDEINWLKSLKERYTWRPSYEQVSVLEFVMGDIEKDSIRYRVLNSVLEDLKKLREEKL